MCLKNTTINVEQKKRFYKILFNFFQTWRYSYSCNKVTPDRAANCTQHQTEKLIIALLPNDVKTLPTLPNESKQTDLKMLPMLSNDRTVKCEENSFLSKFVLKKKVVDSKTVQCWYEYTCCHIE